MIPSVPGALRTPLAACAAIAFSLAAAPSRSLADPATEQVLHTYTDDFQTRCYGCETAPVAGADGRLYGTTIGGGTAREGTLYRLDPLAGYATLYDYADAGGPRRPAAYLVAATDGNLYGVSQFGGRFDGGTVYRIDTAGKATVLGSFHRPSGPNSLMQASDGNLYGTTGFGGAHGDGSIFRVTPDGAEVIFSFDHRNGGCASPQTQLIQASDGNLYGTSRFGAHSAGCVYRISLAGEFQVVYMFGSNGDADGLQPLGRLLQGQDGALYGTTELGGASELGLVYRVTLQGEETILHSFAGADGASPVSSLTQDAAGNLVGLSAQGGALSHGAAWRMAADGSSFEVLYAFGVTRRDGSEPEDMMLAPDGHFYGVTAGGGGKLDNGTLFTLSVQ
jgi:uncharacterized repeat protein (TIGR03803 family)